ncbi:MAG: nickel-binding protein [Gaiellaceae bacterium]|jgi:hypothetical protein
MAEFLAEFYLSPSDREAAQVGADRARLAAEELALRGTPVRYLSSIFLPEDETCFHLYEASSAEAIREVAQRAELSFERVLEAIPNREE